MKTVILNGSPRKGGDTAALLAELKKHLSGEIFEIRAFEENIPPCVDCRACKSLGSCVKKDKLQELLPLLEECDYILIASPIWMETLTPPLLSIASRLQPYFYRPNKAPAKKGSILLVGGGSGGAESAERTARLMLKQLNATEVFPLILSGKTDTLPAEQDQEALQTVKNLAFWLQLKETQS